MPIDVEARLSQALDEALRNASVSSASTNVRSALRVAILRQDPLGELWLRIELEGINASTSNNDRLRDALSRLAALVGSEEAEARRVRKMESLFARRSIETDGQSRVVAHGVSELETHNRSLQALHDEDVTPGMTPVDTGLASMTREKVRSAIAPTLIQQRAVLERIKDAAYAYLVDSESELLRGQTVPDALAEGHAFVEKTLAERSPDALTSLIAAQDRLAHGDEEAMSHAATSCRRAIKALADLLYPPGPPVVDEGGVTRDLDEEHYRNRLVQYVRDRQGKSTHADVLTSNIRTLGIRLKSLDDLASKGVHVKVSKDEARACVSWTYMLAADLLRIEQELDSSRD